jgi:hypothetical protein
MAIVTRSVAGHKRSRESAAAPAFATPARGASRFERVFCCRHKRARAARAASTAAAETVLESMPVPPLFADSEDCDMAADTSYSFGAKEVRAFSALNGLLVASAAKQELMVTSYPSVSMERVLRKIEIKWFEHERSVQRGAFARSHFRKGQFICPYHGLILNQEQFEARYPDLVDKDRRILCLKSEGDYILDPEGPAGIRKPWIIIQDTPAMRALNIVGLKGRYNGEDTVSGKEEILLDGYHQGDHTYSYIGADGEAVSVDAECELMGLDSVAPFSKEADSEEYLLGVGALINSADPHYGVDISMANAKYLVDPVTNRVIIVATKVIKAREQILVGPYDEATYVSSEEMDRYL